MATFIEAAIPFFFILAVVYGSLEVSNVFKKSSVKGLVSLSIAAVTMTSETVSVFVMDILPYAAILFVVFFALGFVLNIFKDDKDGKKKVDIPLLATVAVLVLIFMTTQQELMEDYLPWLSSDNLVFLLGGFLLLIIFYAAYKSSSEDKAGFFTGKK